MIDTVALAPAYRFFWVPVTSMVTAKLAALPEVVVPEPDEEAITATEDTVP